MIAISIGRQVAVKVMLGRAFGDADALRRFEREARASARLNHPNIVAIYDYGPVGADGAYLVMERLQGVTLRSEIARLGCIAPPLAADWFAQIFDGVGAAHSNGVIHRDLKPENVLIIKLAPGHDAIKLLDFGLAKLRPSESELTALETAALTAPGMVMGTAGYMAPEQLAGGHVDERSDIFSLGVMVIEALTGRRPFTGKTYSELLAAILNQSFTLPGSSPEAARLNDVLQKSLAKERGGRFASVAAMAEAMVPAIRACPAFPDAASAGDAETIGL